MLFNENMRINVNIPVDVKYLNPYFRCPWSWIFSLFSVLSVISEALFPWCFLFLSGRRRSPRRWDCKSDDRQEWRRVWPVHGLVSSSLNYIYKSMSITKSLNPDWIQINFHCLFLCSVWIWIDAARKLAIQSENPVSWRRTSCPRGSWKMMQRWKDSPVRKKKRRCSAVAPGREKRSITAIRSQRNSG